jgi:hypothetical protein
MTSNKQYLFVCGCARSGTSGLAGAINASPLAIVGMERYIRRLITDEVLTTELFKRDRFLNVEPGDTFYSDLSYFRRHYQGVGDKYENAVYIGDKIPRLYRYIDMIENNFSSPKIVFILRNIFDVSASYEGRVESGKQWPAHRDGISAVRDWNDSMKFAMPAIKSGKVLPVIFEDLFLHKTGWDRISEFLGIEIKPPIDNPEKVRNDVRLKTSVKQIICMKANFTLYREIVKLAGSSVEAELVS